MVFSFLLNIARDVLRSTSPAHYVEGSMRRLTAVLIVAVLVPALRAEDAPRKVTSVEGVVEYRLGNGARVLLYPEQSRPTVTVNMTVLVGSRFEGYGETGMAHLLEHMVFKGTPIFRDVPKAL